MGQFSFQYPVWTLGICLILAFIAGLLLYFKSNQLSDRSYGQKLFLGFLRITSVFAILLLLLNPLYKFYKETIQKPILIIAQDVSESIVAHDSLFIQNIIKARNQLEGNLKDKFDIQHIEFDNTCYAQKTDRFKGKLTNINTAFEFVSFTFDLQKVKGMILLSDGIQNSGKNPLYNNLINQFPIYPILLGDTTPIKDLWVSNVFFNEIVYAGDKFAIEIDLQAWNLLNEKTTLQLSKLQDGKWISLENINIEISQNNFFATKQFVTLTDKPGLIKYRISASSLNGETHLKNNSREFYVDVLDAKKKILLVYFSPHPDISAIKEGIIENKNYELIIRNVSDQLPKLNEQSLIIFHQLPGPNGVGRIQIEQAKRFNIPSMFILGSQTDITSFNNIQDIVTINGANKTSSEVTPIIRPSFNLFNLSDQSLDYIKRLPPLMAPFGNYTLDPSATILFYQKIGNIETNYPLWVLSDKSAYRSSYLLGEGLWKWKLNEYQNTNSFNFFVELISKNIQYNSTKQDQRKFRISQSKRIFNEGENIPFYGELYNDNNERINGPDVQLIILSSDKLNYNFTFSRIENYYLLNVGSLPPSEYTFQANTEWNRQKLTFQGKFSIQSLDVETTNQVSDFNLLRNLADKSAGKAYMPNEISRLENDLSADNKSKSILIQNLEISPLIDQKWLFILILISLVLEWFLRRFWGSY